MNRFCKISHPSLLLFVVFVIWQDASTGKESVAGESQYSQNQYVEYIEGNIPLIISAPHGGRLSPEKIPDRKSGVLLADANTDLLAREIVTAFYKQTGNYPHVIICHLKRIKVDCNREIVEAAQGSKEAEQAWTDFHEFINKARKSVLENNGRGLYIDLHGHAHPEIRLELGYLLSNRQLKGDVKNLKKLKNKSSIRTLADDGKTSFLDLLRGKNSFGGLMQQRGFPSVPSPVFPHAGDEKYFSGGYNTRFYGELDGGKISGFQLECPRKSVRDTEKNRKAFAKAFVDAAVEYMQAHLGSK